MSAKINRLEGIVILCIVLLPILCLYKGVGSFSLADISIVFTTMLIMMSGKGKMTFAKNTRQLRYFAYYIIISWIIGLGSISLVGVRQNALMNSLFSALRVVMYYLFVCIVVPQIHNRLAMVKLYRIFALVATLVLYYQFIVHLITGRVVLSYFSFLPLANANVDSEALIRLNTYSAYRPYSFFTEPGMYIRYVIPFLVIMLFDKSEICESIYRNNVQKGVEIGLVTVGCLLSGSGQGLVIFGIVYIFYLVYLLREKKINPRRLIVALLVILASVYYINTERFLVTLSRILLSNAGTNASSFGTRILRGFLVYMQLPFHMQFTGIGYGNLDAVLRTFNIVTQFDQANNSGYMNAAAYTLVNTGIVGFCLFISVFIKELFNKSQSQVSRVLASVALVLSFVGGTTIAVMGIMYFVFIYGYTTAQNRRGKNVRV